LRAEDAHPPQATLGVLAVLAAFELLFNQLLIDAMIDLHSHKVHIKQPTKKEPRENYPTNPGITAANLQNPRNSASNRDWDDI
jgi:hypothetical protein